MGREVFASEEEKKANRKSKAASNAKDDIKHGPAGDATTVQVGAHQEKLGEGKEGAKLGRNEGPNGEFKDVKAKVKDFEQADKYKANVDGEVRREAGGDELADNLGDVTASGTAGIDFSISALDMQGGSPTPPATRPSKENLLQAAATSGIEAASMQPTDGAQ